MEHPSENTETDERAVAQCFLLLHCHLHISHHITIYTVLAYDGNRDYMYDAHDVLTILKCSANNRKLLEHYAAILTIAWKLPSIQVSEEVWKLSLRALGSHEAEKFGLLWFL